MLKIDFIGGFNPFMWDRLRCPVCNGNEFVSNSLTGVFCGDCNAKFRVRDTAGDPGCVVDCFVGCESERVFIYAPQYRCQHVGCGIDRGLFDWQDKTCPSNLNHGPMERVKSTHMRWVRPQGFPEYFYLILKTGDYCSDWLTSGGNKSRDRKGPSQKDWDAFQESEDFRKLFPDGELLNLKS